MYKGNTTVVNNTAKYAVIYLIKDSKLNVENSGNLILSNNVGSLVAFKSDIIFTGYVQFVSNHPENESSWTNTTTDIFREGGAITLFHSGAYFNGNCTLQHNFAEDGGGLLSILSKFYVYGNVTIANNTASKNGGGVYLSNSELTCQWKSIFLLSNSHAGYKGGGFHAIGSAIEASSSCDAYCSYTGARLYFNENVAKMGGGISLEACAKLYTELKYHYADEITVNKIIIFTANSAHLCGGAVYVDDDTNSGRMCTSGSKTECFFQV